MFVYVHLDVRAACNVRIKPERRRYRGIESKWRYTVQLDSGEAFKLKPANVRVEGTGGASGAGKAKKGKGKKGRRG